MTTSKLEGGGGGVGFPEVSRTKNKFLHKKEKIRYSWKTIPGPFIARNEKKKYSLK